MQAPVAEHHAVVISLAPARSQKFAAERGASVSKPIALREGGLAARRAFRRRAEEAPPPVVAAVDSPDEIVRVELMLDAGRPLYRVLRFGETVIAPSHLGFVLRDAGKFGRNLALSGTTRRSVDETWEQPWGERRYLRNRFSERLAAGGGEAIRFEALPAARPKRP
jgi:glycosyl hydrolase family 97